MPPAPACLLLMVCKRAAKRSASCPAIQAVRGLFLRGKAGRAVAAERSEPPRRGSRSPAQPRPRPRRCHVAAQARRPLPRGERERRPGRAAMNFLRGVMGGPSAGPQPSGADTVSGGRGRAGAGPGGRDSPGWGRPAAAGCAGATDRPGWWQLLLGAGRCWLQRGASGSPVQFLTSGCVSGVSPAAPAGWLTPCVVRTLPDPEAL